ncbi:hypothetical protein SLA2020_523640 [Shorea laevis]
MVSKAWLIVALLALVVAAECNLVDDLGVGLTHFDDNTCITGHCVSTDEEFLLDSISSEATRRHLAQKRYISYNALKANSVPCSRRGHSYYDCRPQRANPYRRGCSVITHCYRFTN